MEDNVEQFLGYCGGIVFLVICLAGLYGEISGKSKPYWEEAIKFTIENPTVNSYGGNRCL